MHVAWNCCSKFDSNKLESVQIELARIATGLPLFCRIDHLYRETGLEPLAVRRYRKKMIQFYKIHNNMCLDFFDLHHAIPGP